MYFSRKRFKTDSEDIPFKCDLCNLVFKKKSLHLAHCRMHDKPCQLNPNSARNKESDLEEDCLDNQNEPIKVNDCFRECRICHVNFENKEKYLMHAEQHNSDIPKQPINVSLVITKDFSVYNCYDSQRNQTNVKNFDSPDVKGICQLQCKACHISFKTKKQYLRHAELHNSDISKMQTNETIGKPNEHLSKKEDLSSQGNPSVMQNFNEPKSCPKNYKVKKHYECPSSSSSEYTSKITSSQPSRLTLKIQRVYKVKSPVPFIEAEPPESETEVSSTQDTFTQTENIQSINIDHRQESFAQTESSNSLEHNAQKFDEDKSRDSSSSDTEIIEFGDPESSSEAENTKSDGAKSSSDIEIIELESPDSSSDIENSELGKTQFSTGIENRECLNSGSCSDVEIIGCNFKSSDDAEENASHCRELITQNVEKIRERIEADNNYESVYEIIRNNMDRSFSTLHLVLTDKCRTVSDVVNLKQNKNDNVSDTKEQKSCNCGRNSVQEDISLVKNRNEKEKHVIQNNNKTTQDNNPNPTNLSKSDKSTQDDKYSLNSSNEPNYNQKLSTQKLSSSNIEIIELDSPESSLTMENTKLDKVQSSTSIEKTGCLKSESFPDVEIIGYNFKSSNATKGGARYCQEPITRKVEKIRERLGAVNNYELISEIIQDKIDRCLSTLHLKLTDKCKTFSDTVSAEQNKSEISDSKEQKSFICGSHSVQGGMKLLKSKNDGKNFSIHDNNAHPNNPSTSDKSTQGDKFSFNSSNEAKMSLSCYKKLSSLEVSSSNIEIIKLDSPESSSDIENSKLDSIESSTGVEKSKCLKSESFSDIEITDCNVQVDPSNLIIDAQESVNESKSFSEVTPKASYKCSPVLTTNQDDVCKPLQKSVNDLQNNYKKVSDIKVHENCNYERQPVHEELGLRTNLSGERKILFNNNDEENEANFPCQFYSNNLLKSEESSQNDLYLCTTNPSKFSESIKVESYSSKSSNEAKTRSNHYQKLITPEEVEIHESQELTDYKGSTALITALDNASEPFRHRVIGQQNKYEKTYDTKKDKNCNTNQQSVHEELSSRTNIKGEKKYLFHSSDEENGDIYPSQLDCSNLQKSEVPTQDGSHSCPTTLQKFHDSIPDHNYSLRSSNGAKVSSSYYPDLISPEEVEIRESEESVIGCELPPVIIQRSGHISSTELNATQDDNWETLGSSVIVQQNKHEISETKKHRNRSCDQSVHEGLNSFGNINDEEKCLCQNDDEENEDDYPCELYCHRHERKCPSINCYNPDSKPKKRKSHSKAYYRRKLKKYRRRRKRS